MFSRVSCVVIMCSSVLCLVVCHVLYQCVEVSVCLVVCRVLHKCFECLVFSCVSCVVCCNNVMRCLVFSSVSCIVIMC